MTTNWKDRARAALEGSESGTMTFPQSLQALMEVGFDGYAVDFRRSTRTYYMPNGETIEASQLDRFCANKSSSSVTVVRIELSNQPNQ